MGNCSLKADCEGSPELIRVLTDTGSVIQFKAPKQVHQIVEMYPGYGVFQQGQSSTPLSNNECLTSGKFYYLLPLCKDESFGDYGPIAEPVHGVEQPKMPSAATDVVENLANGSGFEVLPSGGDGVWRVKLVIDTKQLEEIFSEQVNTEALIEKMRNVAATSLGSPTTPRRTKSWKLTLYNVFKLMPFDMRNKAQIKDFCYAVEI